MTLRVSCRALQAATAFCFAVFALPSLAQETTLIFATVNPPNAHLSANILVPWAKRVNEKGKGIVKLDVRDGLALANLGNAYDRVLTDVVQVAWTIQGAVGGKFAKTEVVGLPFVSSLDSEVGSVALWRLYKSGLLASDYDEIVPLYLCQITQAAAHFTKQPKSLDSLKGLKMIVTSRILGQSAARLGVTPSTISLNDTYEALQRGTVNGIFTGWTAFQPFKLAEVTSYHVDVALGASTGMVFMSKKKWDALPEPVRKLLEAESGEAQSREFGAFWNKVSDSGRAMVKADKKHTIVNLSSSQEKKWRSSLTPVVAQWSKATPDGAKVLQSYQALMKQAEAGK